MYKIDAIAASWDRVKFSLGTGPRWQTLQRAFWPWTPEIRGNLRNPMKSRKSMEKERDRVKFALGAGPRWQTLQQVFCVWTIEIRGNLWSLMKSSELSNDISWNPRKSLKIDKIPASWDRVKVSFGCRTSMANAATSLLTLDPWNPWKSMKSYEIPGNPLNSMK